VTVYVLINENTHPHLKLHADRWQVFTDYDLCLTKAKELGWDSGIEFGPPKVGMVNVSQHGAVNLTILAAEVQREVEFVPVETPSSLAGVLA